MKLKRTMWVPNGFQRDNGEDQHNWMDDEMQKFGETVNAKWIDLTKGRHNLSIWIQNRPFTFISKNAVYNAKTQSLFVMV